jgi:hypothetical protein
MQHDRADGQWTVEELPRLKMELSAVAARFRQLPPERLENAFEHNRHLWEVAESLYDCFHSVDEENLFEALQGLCDIALASGRSISFQ